MADKDIQLPQTLAPGVELMELYGYCPVQGEGTIDGKSFYFRARGSHWSLGIGGEPVGEPEWYYDEPYGNGPFDAGWMPLDEAIAFIKAGAERYRTGLVRT